MNRTQGGWAALLGALACAGSAQAHHSGGVYDTTPHWITGTVIRFERVNPHTLTTLEARSDDGQIHRWAVEGPPWRDFEARGREGDAPKVGDAVQFCAFAYKEEFASRQPPTEADGVLLQRVEGHVLVRSDGTRRMWDGHGRLGECIRITDDQRPSWLAFLNTNPGVRQAFCEQRTYPTNPSKAFVEEINGLLAEPCR